MKKKLLSMLLAILTLGFLFFGNPVIPQANASSTSSAVRITSQPKSVSAYSGKDAKVTVKASGKGLKYAWYYKDKGAKSFKKTNSFKSNTYTIEMTSARNGRQIYCKITDTYGNSVKTNTVTLTMRNKAKITTQPKSVSAYNGDTANVTVKASGDGLKYTWYFKEKGAKSFSKTSSFTGSSYSVVMNTKRDGRQVYCKVTDKYGNTVKTKTVTLSLKKAIKITSQPKSVAVYDGERATVSLAAKGVNLKYTWYSKDKGAKTFSKTNTFKGTTYSVAMTDKRDGRQIYCKITDKYGNTKKTETVTLYAKKPPLQIDCEACLAKTDGIRFNPDLVYTQETKLTKMPLTFEAVFQIGKKDIDTAMRPLDRYTDYTETVLFSNDDTYDVSICVSVTEDGHPKLGLRQKDWYVRFNNLLFNKVNVFSDDPVHMAITIDHANTKAHCYINGKLKQSLTLPKAVRKAFVPTYCYAVGGDLYSGNPNYFRGELYSLGVWTDLRSTSEVAADYYAGIDTADSKLAAYYDFRLCDTCAMQDLSAKGNDLNVEKLWLTKDEVEPVGEYDYAFAVIGDTQELSEDDPEAFAALYDWIVDNQESEKIEYVLGLGDITQKSYAHEWEYAQKVIYKLNGVVPYLLTRGNHDYNTVENGVITAGFNKTFDDGIYNEQLTGVMEEGDLSNAYRTIEIGGIDYLFMTLDFGPDAETLDWANSVVAEHPDHRVIMVTHGYMYRDGTTLDANDAYSASRYPLRDKKEEQATNPSLDGDDIWREFASKHENIQLVISGHDPCQHVVYRQDSGEKGNTVTQMLVDPQHIDSHYAPTSMIAMFYFSDNGNTLTVRYYSVTQDLYGSERSQFTIDLS